MQGVCSAAGANGVVVAHLGTQQPLLAPGHKGIAEAMPEVQIILRSS